LKVRARSTLLRRRSTDLGALGRVELPGESKVDDLDLVGVGGDTKNVLWFEVKM